MKKILTAFLLFFSLMIEAQTTYYIDPAGNNGNSGSIDSPWLTLAYACTQATTSGDIIHVNTGTYTETTQSVLAIGVSIEGTGVTSIIISNITTAYAGTLYLASGTEGTNGNQHISGIYFDGNSQTTYCAIWVRARSNVEIYNCTFVNYSKYGARFHGNVPGGTPSTSTVYATGNKVHDCVFTNNAYYQSGVGGGANIFMDCQTGFLCYNNTITQSRTTYTNGTGVKTNGWTKGLKIYDNTITADVNTNGNHADAYDFCIEIWGDVGSVTEGVEIYNNKIYNSAIDMAGRITQKGTYDYGCSIHDNFIGCTSLPSGSKIGIILEATTDAGGTDGLLSDFMIYNNHLKNINYGIITYSLYGDLNYSNFSIYYNIFEAIGQNIDGNSGARAIWLHANNHTGSIVDNWKIYNNVMVATTRTGSTQPVGLQLGIDTYTNVDIKNNILAGWDIAPIYTETSGSIDNFWIQNNMFYGNGNSNLPDINIAPTHYTNSGNLTSNPLFVSTSDFHLTSGSPAINAGIQLTTPFITTDYDSVTIGNPPDIGAYEFISNHAPSIQDQGFQLKENSPGGTDVGTVKASDPDAGQTLTYSIVSGNTNDAFAIDALTGKLSVANSSAINGDFKLVVKVLDNGGGELSSQATISVNIIPTGIEMTKDNRTIKVFPNPVADELTIEFKGNIDRISFKILNSTGQIVYKGNLIEKAVVQTSSFSPGVYLMKIEDGRTFEFKKILKV